MGTFKDITGQKFGRLTAISFIKEYNGKRYYTYWICKCHCGKETRVNINSLTSGQTKSCGCYNYDMHYKHGHTICAKPSRTFKTWEGMLSRCYRVKDKCYLHYGGRNICVCDRWKDSFENFLADMGERPEGMTLDRIDVNGNYELKNCKWSTISEQNNNKTNSVKITFNNETHSASEWARIANVSPSTILRRLRYNKPILK